MWFEGYWWWVPSTGDTGAQKFALWQVTGAGTGDLIADTTVTSGQLTAGQWNYVPLPTPVVMSIGTCYCAATGWEAVNGFPVTNNQFAGGDPYSGGITNGPLTAYSDQDTAGGDLHAPYQMPQGLFGVAGSDPSVTMPSHGSNSANFWMDVQVSDTVPSGYAGSWRLFPNAPVPQNHGLDDAANYVLATEFTLSVSCTLNNIWFYSPSGTTQLPTDCGIWDVSTQTTVANTHNTSPAWSGAPGFGWVSCSYSAITLPPGDYKVAVLNSAAQKTIWNATTEFYWNGSGPVGWGGAPNGITTGPLYAPDAANATSPGQSTYHVGSTWTYPDSFISSGAYNYWVDVEVTEAS